MQFIDPHIHLFNLALGQYQWLKPENPPFWPDKSIINNNFTEADLYLFDDQPTENALKRAGFVHIEAGFNNEKPWEEIQWLESHCNSSFKSVACVDLTLPPQHFNKHIQTLITYKSVVGCRHILDDSASEILNNKNTKINLKQLADNQLSFDLQMPLADLHAINVLCLILKSIPTLSVIINHAGFPPYFSDVPASLNENVLYKEHKDWRSGLKMLSQFMQCAIKCSGWEMTERQYTAQWCNHIITQCINDFGINRVMLSSNFPLCLFSHSYQSIWQQYSRLDIQLGIKLGTQLGSSLDTRLDIQLGIKLGTQLGSSLDTQLGMRSDIKLEKQQLNQLCLENAKHWYKF